MTEQKQSFRDLILQRKTSDSRAIHRHRFVLVPELYAEWEDLNAELQDLAGSNDEDDPNVTISDVPPKVVLQEKIADLEQQMTETSVTAIFKALSAERSIEIGQTFQADKQRDLVKTAKTTIRESFVRFDTDEDLGPGDLDNLLEALTQGELLGLSNKLTSLAMAELNVPKSPSPFVRTSRPDAT